MAFVKKTWKDRLVEFAGRRQLTRISGDPNGTMIVDVARSEGTVSQNGDAFSKENMNDLENRIENAFEYIDNNLAQQPVFIYDSNGKITGYQTPGGADTVFPFSSGEYTLKVQVYSLATGYNNVACNGTAYLIDKENKIVGQVAAAVTVDGGYPGRSESAQKQIEVSLG